MRKKLLSFVLCLCAGMSLHANELNIYASGLNATQSAGVTTIDYVLNAPATALNVKLYDGSTLIATIPVTGAANLTKGSHSDVAITLPNLNGTFTWALEASADGHNDLIEFTDDASVSKYHFYATRDVAVDNSPESDFFGYVYVANANQGTTSSNSVNRFTAKGVFIFNSLLEQINSTAYDGNVSWTGSAAIGTNEDTKNDCWGPYRLAIAEDGYVFITDNGVYDSDNTGVYMMDPYHPENDFTSVLGHAGKSGVFRRANSIAVTGSGASRVLYLNDWTDDIYTYAIGNSFPCTVRGPKAVPNLASSNIVMAQNCIARDNDGGFWLSQLCTGKNTYPQLAHFNSSGVLDYSISSTQHSSLAAANTRGASVGLNPSNSIVAFGGGGKVNIFTLVKKDGVPELTPTSYSPLSVDVIEGKHVDGIAFDVADNMYVVSGYNERLRIFATPKADNRHETPAKAANTITATASPVERSVTSGNWGTVCFPHEVTAANRSGATFFSIAGKRTSDGTASGTPTSIVLTEVPAANDLTAGEPYIFQATASSLTATFTGTAVPAGNANGLIGTYVTIDVEAGKYLLSSGQVVKAGTGCSIAANRAYIDMDEVPVYAPTPAPGRIVDMPLAPDNATQLTGTNQTAEASKFILNGQLYIRRNGITYDALGRIVK